MKLTTIIGVIIGFALVVFIKANYNEMALATTPTQQAPASTAPAKAATTATTAPPAKPVIPIKQGSKPVYVRGVKMPGNCLHLQPELVTYVEQHGDPKQPGYVADKDIPEYVCGWDGIPERGN